MRSFIALLTGLSILALVACAACAQDLPPDIPPVAHYTVRDLGDTFENRAWIDDGGNVIVTSNDQGAISPAIIAPNGTTRLLQGRPDTEYLEVIGSTSSGQVLCRVDDDFYLWDASGNPRQLNLGGAGDNVWWSITAIDNRGYMVGSRIYRYTHEVLPDLLYDYTYSSSAWLLWPNGRKVQLRNARGFDCSFPLDINDAGWIVGSATTEEASTQAFPSPHRYRPVLWSPTGGAKLLKCLGNATACAISNTGLIVGYGSSALVVWNTKGKIVRTLSYPSWMADCRPADIDNKGIVVGSASVHPQFDNARTALVWDQKGRLAYLPPLPGHVFAYPDHISNNGEIVGWSFSGDYLSGPFDAHLVVWTQQPLR